MSLVEPEPAQVAQDRPSLWETAAGKLTRAFFTSPLEIAVGLAVAGVGLSLGGVPGQALTGLGGVLISYSTTLAVSEERSRAAAARRERDLREREVSRLQGFYRQIYNTHLQIVEATAEADERGTSFALITQSNRNLFFLLTEIEAIVGELDIRVASLTNRMRSNMQEMEILRAVPPDESAAARLSELEAEQIALKQQIADATAGTRTSTAIVETSFSSYLNELRELKAPSSGSPAAEWMAFLRHVVESLAASPLTGPQLVERSLPLTLLGNVLRAKAGFVSVVAGFRGLQPQLQYALAGSAYCVVKGTDPYRGVALRLRIPSGLSALPDLVGSSVDDVSVVADTQRIATLMNLPVPTADWTLIRWGQHLRDCAVELLKDREEVSLQVFGSQLSFQSDIPLPRVSGIANLSSTLQYALAGSSFCVVQKSEGAYAVTLRQAAEAHGLRLLPDIELQDGIGRIGNPPATIHSLGEYRKLLRLSVPALAIPLAGLPEITAAVATLAPDAVPVDALIDEIGGSVDSTLQPRIRPVLALLQSVGVLDASGDRFTLHAPGTGAELLEQVKARVIVELERRLGTVDVRVVDELVGMDTAVGPAAYPVVLT